MRKRKLAMKRSGQRRCSLCKEVGHRRDACPSTKDKTAKPLRQLDKATAYRNTKPAQNKGLKDLKQVGLPELMQLTEQQAERRLRSLGLMPILRRRKCFKCKGCMKRFKYGSRNVGLRCSVRKCDCKISRADLTYTPLWRMQKGGHVSFKEYLIALYIFAVKVPMGAAQHLASCSRDTIKYWYKAFKNATAFAELYNGSQTVFEDGALEVDGTATNVARSSPTHKKHCGRFLIIYHRDTGKYMLRPLKDADVFK